MKTEKKYSWIFRFYDVVNGTVYYRLYHKLTVDDVDFLVNEFRKANTDYRLGVFKLRSHKRNTSE